MTTFFKELTICAFFSLLAYLTSIGIYGVYEDDVQGVSLFTLYALFYTLDGVILYYLAPLYAFYTLFCTYIVVKYEAARQYYNRILLVLPLTAQTFYIFAYLL